MRIAIQHCKRILLLLILCNYQQLSVAIQEQAAKLTAKNLITTNEIITKSKDYNNLVDNFRKNWESPMAYLIQRGYIPIDEAKPDKTSRDTIKKMQKEYGEAGKNVAKELNYLMNFENFDNKKTKRMAHIKSENFEKYEKPFWKLKKKRRDATKPPCTTTTTTPATTPVVNNNQTPVTEMQCVKWEPVLVSTTPPALETAAAETASPATIDATIDITTDSQAPPTALAPSSTLKPCIPQPQSTIMTTTTTTMATTIVSASKPNKLNAADDEECEEYYEDVTECYEYETYDDGLSMLNTTTPTSTTPTTTSSTFTVPPRTLPKCTTPSSIADYNEFEALNWPLNSDDKEVKNFNYSNMQTDENNSAFLLASKIAQNTVNEYLKNNYQPKLSNSKPIATALQWAKLRLKRAKNQHDVDYDDEDDAANTQQLQQKQQPQQVSWQNYRQSWYPQPVNWRLQKPTYAKKLYPGPHPPIDRLFSNDEKLWHPGPHPPVERPVPQKNYKHYYQVNKKEQFKQQQKQQLKQERQQQQQQQHGKYSNNVSKLQELKSATKFAKNSLATKMNNNNNNNVRFKNNNNNKMNTNEHNSKADEYDYYEYEEMFPPLDTGFVSLKAVYIMNNKNYQNDKPESLSQHFDNIEPQSTSAQGTNQHMKSSANKFNSPKWKNFVDAPNYINSKPTKQEKTPVKAKNFHKANTATKFVPVKYTQQTQSNLKKSNSHKPQKYKAQNYYAENSQEKNSNPNKKQADEDFLSENKNFLNSKLYDNTYDAMPLLDNSKYSTYKDDQLWTPILLDPKTEDRSIYAKYKAKNDPLKHEFWRNIQNSDKDTGLDLFEAHKPDPTTYPNEDLLNLYKYKNMNKNLENYFKFDHDFNQSVENKTTVLRNANKKKKDTKKSQKNFKLNGNGDLKNSANSIIDTAVRNVTDNKTHFNKLKPKRKNFIEKYDDYF